MSFWYTFQRSGLSIPFANIVVVSEFESKSNSNWYIWVHRHIVASFTSLFYIFSLLSERRLGFSKWPCIVIYSDGYGNYVTSIFRIHTTLQTFLTRNHVVLQNGRQIQWMVKLFLKALRFHFIKTARLQAVSLNFFSFLFSKRTCSSVKRITTYFIIPWYILVRFVSIFVLDTSVVLWSAQLSQLAVSGNLFPVQVKLSNY